ncbi:MAG: bifunctional nuclease family protein [Bacteroidetes bacterium]|nr:bifunctional nuclease family protein [Bacteroidota bacterium]
MDKIELVILGISSGHTAASYTLILEEKNGQRKLPVVIGASEAQSIAVQIEGIKPVRPMTHDLMKSIMSNYQLEVQEVIISKLEEGIFYADLYANGPDGVTKIDARTSDAIAMAIRFGASIFTTSAILDEAGIVLTDKESEQISKNLEEDDEEDLVDAEQELLDALEESTDFQTMTVDELEDLLNQALEDEDYDTAAKIRDEINNRQNN